MLNEDLMTQEKKISQRRDESFLWTVSSLCHMFTQKFVHVSSTRTSSKDKNYMVVHLSEHNAKHAKFKILPRYKVKAEGDVVQLNDQVVFESVKSPGQFLHSSRPYAVDNFTNGCEVNLGVHQTGFTVIRSYHPASNQGNLVKGGSMVRLFHKEIEAYLTAEGLFNDEVTEDVHLRIRSVDQMKPKTCIPSSSAITYWQIEAEEFTLLGNVIHWEHQIRLRHCTTRMYLCVHGNMEITLTDDHTNPNTVFRLHPVIKEREEIEFETYTRIQHVLTGAWLHALHDDDYTRKRQRHNSDKRSLSGLPWDGAQLKKITLVKDQKYDDAFTIQQVNRELVSLFNYASGMVPVISNLIQDRRTGKKLTPRTVHPIISALDELRGFMIISGVPSKPRQKLMRNLRIVDLLVQLLHTDLPTATDRPQLSQVFEAAYRVLSTYLKGDSRKNELYFAKHIDFFQTQFDKGGSVGLQAAVMITELIRDNRKIVDRITKQNIDSFIGMLKRSKKYHYLDLLDVLCVCDGVALRDNQTYITQEWLAKDKVGVYLTDLGQAINKQEGVVYVSVDNGTAWLPLHQFAQQAIDGSTASKEQYLFLVKQLGLFGKLCTNHNDYALRVITKELKYLTWEEAITCLSSDVLPDALRAKYCELMVDLFINTDVVQSVTDTITLSFVYTDLGKKKSGQSPARQSSAVFPRLRSWIASFLDQNKDMTASLVGRNKLIQQVLKLLHYLVRFGYYGDADDIRVLLSPLLSLLDGRNDKPYPVTKEKSKEYRAILDKYQQNDRFLPSIETQAIVDAKHQAMEVVDLFLTFQGNTRLQSFVTKFKHVEESSNGSRKRESDLIPLLYQNGGRYMYSEKSPSKAALNELDDIFQSSAYFSVQNITEILMDLARYQYDMMVSKSMMILNKLYSEKSDLFNRVVQAQVLITDASCQTYAQVQAHMPVLRRLAGSKPTQEQLNSVTKILDTFTSLCHLPGEPDERHPMNQTILVNSGIVAVIFDTLSREIDTSMADQYATIKPIFEKSLRLLQYLARGNPVVQERMYQRFDSLLDVQGLEKGLALALTEVFTGNYKTCLKILPSQIQHICKLTAQYQDNAAEFLDLLCAVVKVEELNLPIKRNQAYVMQYIMQNYSKICYVFDKTEEMRLTVLSGEQGKSHLSYLFSLVDLLAACAEGENQLIESQCQTILPVDEVLNILNITTLTNNLKRPFLRYLLWVFMNTASSRVESGASDLPHERLLWSFIAQLPDVVLEATSYVMKNKETCTKLLKKSPPKSAVASGSNPTESRALGDLHYLFEAVLPFIKVFFKKFYTPDEESYPQEAELVDKLARSLIDFCDAIGPCITLPNHMKVMVESVTMLLTASTLSISVMEGFVQKYSGKEVHSVCSAAMENYLKHYAAEQDLNEKLNHFATNYSRLYSGRNTVSTQLGWHSDREYCGLSGDEPLPLGQEFQAHVSCFVNSGAKSVKDKYARAGKLVEQLSISARNVASKERTRLEQERLEIKSLQILRALVHNEERKLPENWGQELRKHASHLEYIRQVQDTLNSHGVVLKAIHLLASANESVARDVLALLTMMLFNANKTVQKSLQKYFLSTREEVFFSAIRNKMHLSIQATKEKRALAAQHQARVQERLAQQATLRNMMTQGRNAVQDLQDRDKAHRLKQLKKTGATTAANGKPKSPEKQPFVSASDVELTTVTVQTGVDNAAYDDDEDDFLEEVKDEGSIELVLKMMARVCDGQNTVLQNYLRHQPDNIRSVNLVAETVQFLGVMYSSIKEENIDLVIAVFETLNEFASGNQANRVVIFDNKIIDYINFILRAGALPMCSLEKMVQLKKVIGILLHSLVEESGPKPMELAKQIQESLDQEGIMKYMNICFSVNTDQEVLLDLKESIQENGFLYFFVFNRLLDVRRTLSEELMDRLNASSAFQYYQKNTASIEILKEGELQKIQFRVENRDVLREEVKEKLKWEIDRSSPTNKIRDFMAWSKDILQDIYYQRKMLKYPAAAFLTNHWVAWNNLCILLSFLINIFMVITWKAPASLETIDVLPNATALPKEIDDPVPVPLFPEYKYILWTAGGIHNILSLLVVITFAIANHPRIPTATSCKKLWSCVLPKSKMDDPDDSKLAVDMISFQTLYYILFLGFSIAGTAFHGYFFAFHLFNIINDNQILKRVIKAVTLNGKSLLWVAVLGLVIIYIYSLLSFAVLRSHFDPEESFFCNTLYECFVTLLHYGLIGHLMENLPVHTTEVGFVSFAVVAIFHVSFFIIITTIGLNIVFGIIVDTFAELRDFKWHAEQDMRENCFICNCGSYDFDHYAKGFDHHVKHEHNMWAYIFFFIYLHDTDPKDQTTLELHVSKRLKKKKYDFFPTNNALSLRSKHADAGDTKLDEVLDHVVSMMKKQHQEEMQKQISEERQKQHKWEQQHRGASQKPSPREGDATPGPTTTPRPTTMPRDLSDSIRISDLVT